MAPAAGDKRPCPGLTASAIPTALRYGQIELARQWLAWLLDTQLNDGAIPDAGLQHASLFNTGQTLRALLADEFDWPAAHEAARRAAGYLTRHVHAQGRLAPSDHQGGSFDLWAGPAVQLAALAALSAAARRWHAPEWQAAAQRAVRFVCRTVQPHGWTGTYDDLAQAADALLGLERIDLARAAVRLPTSAQRNGGTVPAEITAGWTCSATLAHLAAIWYRLGERERADRAMTCLVLRQRPSGGFYGSWGYGARYHPRREAAWTAKHFLDAAQLQVEAAFERPGTELPDQIEPTDGRLIAVRYWLNTLVPAPELVDVGCGTGRFLRRILEWRPSARLVGIDPSGRMESAMPQAVEFRQGGLLRIPARDGEFDGALAIESLEHALLPEAAVGELCRVVRPGGGILIIDKRRSKQALSVHEPWEQWFTPGEVGAWLSRYCVDVSVREVTHGPAGVLRGLFLCWQARRRGHRGDRQRMKDEG